MPAYQTLSIDSPADLVLAVNNFAVANGWTLSGGNLSKGGSYVNLNAATSTQVIITGGRAGVFTGIDSATTNIRAGTWSAVRKLEMFYHTDPDTIWVVFHWEPGYYFHMGFGTLYKYGVWDGGGWIHGQHANASANIGANIGSVIDGDGTHYYTNTSGECGLFWQPSVTDAGNGYFVDSAASKLHCELRGYIWEGSTNTTNGGRIFSPGVLTPIHKLNPNTFNSQTILSPHELYLLNTDGNMMPVGYVGHCRFVKLTNYNPEDIITIGLDKWKVYPRLRRDPTYPDGAIYGYEQRYSTGYLGIAIRYDGP